MDLSYWEKKEWFNNIDTLIIGSGIVGFCSAIEILKKNPNISSKYLNTKSY